MKYDSQHKDWKCNVEEVRRGKVGGGVSEEASNMKEIYAVADEEEMRKCGMIFHLTDAKRMLASVDKIVKAENKVEFGPKEEDNFIQNTATGEKIMLKKENGVYTMKVLVKVGGRNLNCTIVVDSGASECVMPKEWFPELPVMSPKKGIKFAGANGKDLGNYGRKLVEFMQGFQRQA